MTWLECERYYAFYQERESKKIDEISKLFAFRNLESVRIAHHGKQRDCEKYLRDLQKINEVLENNMEDQFQGVDFGK